MGLMQSGTSPRCVKPGPFRQERPFLVGPRIHRGIEITAFSPPIRKLSSKLSAPP